MRRKNTTPGSKFTVRGQVYIQTGAFYHPISKDREVRVLELDTTCPECSQTFQTTASLRQISTRQLVRRCPECRKIHSGPVPIAMPAAQRARKNTPGRSVGKLSPRLRAVPAVAKPKAQARISICADEQQAIPFK
jgi:hypothetical protein